MVETFLIFLFAYFAGSINFAIIFFKLTGRGDPRLSFSGNAGTTNVYRQAGMMWAAVIFLLDIGRALAVAAVAIHFLDPSLLPWVGLFLVFGNSFPCFHGFRGGKGVANYLGFTMIWVGFFLVFGNSFPCFHGFRGGKGVANYLGFTMIVAPWAALASAVIWVAIYYGITRIPFIASFFMVLTLAFGQALYLDWQFNAVAGAMATFLLIIFNHRKNIVNNRENSIR
jgi:acyl phosphate:glycerol-3-phosphate acyltransferase